MSRLSLPLFHVDAFTDKAFHGNPAAVCLVPPGISLGDDLMLKIAAENNLSETAYLIPATTTATDPFQEAVFRLRWFTPTREVALCGHATLATAKVLAHIGNRNCEISYETLSGLLVTRHDGDGSIFQMKFPVNHPVEVCRGPEITTDRMEGVNLPELITAIFGLGYSFSNIDRVWYSSTTKKLIFQLVTPGRAPLVSLSPSIPSMMASHDGSKVTGISVTSRALSMIPESSSVVPHFHSRYFAPWNGINEDPVNGSSHTILGPLWGSQIPEAYDATSGMIRLRAEQSSKRGGVLTVKLAQVDPKEVFLGGAAVIVSEGHLYI